ncbi:hypothetical protein B0H14DRAFT_2826756, partial [Mycena olivaceomarginata]
PCKSSRSSSSSSSLSLLSASLPSSDPELAAPAWRLAHSCHGTGATRHTKRTRGTALRRRGAYARARNKFQNRRKMGAGEKGGDDDAHFPGLVNMSGTHCFMNLTLQALASLSNLPPYLLGIRTRAEALDVPTPVVDAHIDLLAALNTPSARSPSSRPSVRPRPPSAPLTPLHPPPPPPPLRRPL